MGVDDPIADLATEIAAEEAAADKAAGEAKTGESKADVAGKTGKIAAKSDDPKKPNDDSEAVGIDDDEESEGDGEVGGDEEDDAAGEAGDIEAKSEPKRSKERLIPVSERNKEAAARRKAERALEVALAENASLKKPAVEGEKPVITDEQRDAQAVARARLSLQLEEFVNVGNKSYGLSEDGRSESTRLNSSH